MQIIRLSEVDSTNEYVKRELCSLPEKALVWADAQTAGKGSSDRRFSSPKGGVYLSILFPSPDPSVFPFITPVAAVATRRALARVFDVRPEIKWVNDLYLSGKKICGILCEHFSSSVVVGIGVNLVTPENGFDESIRDIAGAALSFSPCDEQKEFFVQTIAEEFFTLLSAPVLAVREYREHSFVIGKRVSVTAGDRTLEGVAEGIDDFCRLLLRTENGVIPVFSGTLRLL